MTALLVNGQKKIKGKESLRGFKHPKHTAPNIQSLNELMHPIDPGDSGWVTVDKIDPEDLEGLNIEEVDGKMQLSSPQSNDYKPLFICDPATIPTKFSREIVNTPSFYNALLTAAVTTPWIHYTGTQGAGIFRQDLAEKINTSDFAKTYLEVVYGITNLDNPKTSNEEDRKEALLLAGLDPNLRGAMRNGLPYIKGNRNATPLTERTEPSYDNINSIEFGKGVLDYLGLEDDPNVLKVCEENPQFLLPAFAEDSDLEITAKGTTAHVKLKSRSDIKNWGTTRNLNDTFYGEVIDDLTCSNILSNSSIGDISRERIIPKNIEGWSKPELLYPK